jgi:hypothetical protein
MTYYTTINVDKESQLVKELVLINSADCSKGYLQNVQSRNEKDLESRIFIADPYQQPPLKWTKKGARDGHQI